MCARLVSDVRGNKLRLLQVGLGGWGRDWAWRIVPGVKSVKVVGYVDLNPEALAQARQQVAMPAEQSFTSLDRALEGAGADAVLVTTLLPGHVPVVRAALEAGKHVLVEKPFARRPRDASELVVLAAKRDRILMVSQNYRFYPAVREVRRLVKAAPLGELAHISVDFRRYSPIGPNGPGPHHSDPQPLLVDMSIHHFDLMRLILGREAMSVSCQAWNPSWSGFQGPPAAVASITFEGGLIVSYRGSWISSGAMTPWAGEWRMQFERGEVLWTSRGDDSSLAEVVIVQRSGAAPEPIALPPMPRIDRWGVLSEFASAIRSHREPLSSGRDNLRTLALVDAAVESASRGRQVSVRLEPAARKT
jgi:predicted dehydrogenase